MELIAIYLPSLSVYLMYSLSLFMDSYLLKNSLLNLHVVRWWVVIKKISIQRNSTKSLDTFLSLYNERLMNQCTLYMYISIDASIIRLVNWDVTNIGISIPVMLFLIKGFLILLRIQISEGRNPRDPSSVAVHLATPTLLWLVFRG